MEGKPRTCLAGVLISGNVVSNRRLVFGGKFKAAPLAGQSLLINLAHNLRAMILL